MKTINSKRHVFEEYCAILANFENLLIISPFIKISSLDRLLCNSSYERVTIVTSWKVANFIQKVSDVDIFPYAQRNNITLLANNRIHLKVFTNEDFTTVVTTSANITDAAMGVSANYNFEYGVVLDDINIDDKLYFDTIIQDSITITEEIYEETLNKIDISQFDKHIEEIKLNRNSCRVYSLQDLPAINSPERLIELLKSPNSIENEVERRNFEHDKRLFQFLNTNSNNYFESLKKSYYDNDFIQTFLQYNGSGKHFGELTSWIHNICTDSPVPRRANVKEYVKRLFDYTVYLSKGCYQVIVPGAHSEKLVQVKELNDE